MALKYNTSNYRISFSPKVHITLVALLTTILFFSLGLWQLKRADEKKIREQQAKIEEKKLPVVLPPHPQAYQHVQIKGRYLDQNLLLDNQHEQHQLGYHVLTPMLLQNNKIIIIDRGWIKKEDALIIRTPYQQRVVRGKVYYPSSKQWLLGEPLEIKSNKMTITQTQDTELFSRFLQKSVYPFIIHLDASEPDGFIRHWIINNMPWQRHIAYAIQWFIFSIIVITLYLVRNTHYEKK